MAKIFFLFVLYLGSFSTKTGGSINSDPAPGRSPGPPFLNISTSGEIEETVKLLLIEQNRFSGTSEEGSKSLNLKNNTTETSADGTMKNSSEYLCEGSLENYFQNFGPINLIKKHIFNSKTRNGTDFDNIISITHSIFSSESPIVCGLLYKVILDSNSFRNIKDFYLETVTSKAEPTGTFIQKSAQNFFPISWFHLNDGKMFWTEDVNRNEEEDLTNSGLKMDNIKSKTNCLNNKWTGEFQNNTQMRAFWILDEYCDDLTAVEFRLYFSLRKEEEAKLPMILSKNVHYNVIKECQLWLKNTSGNFDHTQLPLYTNNCTVYFPKIKPISYGDTKFLVKIKKLNVACDSGGYLQIKNKTKLCGKYEEIRKTDLLHHFEIDENSFIIIHKNVMFSIEYQLVDYCYNMLLTDRNNSFKVEVNREYLDCNFKIHLPYGNQVNLTLVVNPDSKQIQHERLLIDKVESLDFLDYKSHTNLFAKNYFNSFNNNNNTNNSNTNNNNDSNNNNNSSNNSNNDFNNNNNNKSNNKTTFISDNNNSNTSNINSFEYTEKNNNNNYENIDSLDSFKSESTNTSCDGILLEIIDKKKNFQWTKCIKKDNIKETFHFISSSNILIVRIRYNYNHQNKFSFNNNSKKVKQLPIVFLSYIAIPIIELVQDCQFGWIAWRRFCISAIEKELTWYEGEQHCINNGGHLASVRSEAEENIIDTIIMNSPGYQQQMAYWIGGSDKNFEGDFRWTDGNNFQYSRWFPGWSHHNNYNKQPNDDGLSNQDCIEIRKYFKMPPIVLSVEEPFTKTFMWNDRNCNEKNFLICKTHMSQEDSNLSWTNDCNKTVSLTKEHPRASVWSPEFPKPYPDNANCYTTIIAPASYKIIVEFEELVIENEPSCQYDYLEIIEPSHNYLNMQNISKPNTTQRPSYDDFNLKIDFEITKNVNHQNILNIFSDLYESPSNYLIKTPEYPKGYTIFPTKSSNYEYFTKRICGDWSPKLKLLRYISNNSILGLHFVSDYSHHFGGFKAKIFMQNKNMECPDERLVFHNGSCYLFGSYPEVDWWTAQQICRGIGAKLSSISSSSENKFLITSIRNQIDYNPQIIYWLGGKLNEYGKFEWTSNDKMIFEGWLPDQSHDTSNSKIPMCLGLQWKVQPSTKLPSGLYWESEICQKTGGYICKQKTNNEINNSNLQNETISGTEGRLTSPAYPNQYPSNTDYWVHLVAPDKHRIVIQFQKIDLEAQSECLYDFITIQNLETVSKISLEPGSNLVPIAMLTSERNLEESNYDNWLYYLKRIRRSTVSKLSRFDSLFHGQYIIERKDKKHRFRNKKSRRKKRTLKMAFTEETVLNQRNFDNDIKYNAQTFLPYVRWCGRHDTNMSKFDFVSLSNEAIINFHSDYSNSGAGFAAIWKAIDLSGCPLQILTSKEGVIQSPNYPHFLLNNLDCTYVIQAPNNKRIWLEFLDYNLINDATLYLDIGNGWFEPFKKYNHVNDGIYFGEKEQIKVKIETGSKPRGKGFKISFKTDSIGKSIEERLINLANNTNGNLYHLNYPNNLPSDINFSQHFIAPLGNVILLEVFGYTLNENECLHRNFLEVVDNYADNNGTKWYLCDNANESKDFDNLRERAPVHITSYLNTLHIRQKSFYSSDFGLNASVRLQQDLNLKLKLATGDDFVETCHPNPCKEKGKCISKKSVNKCQCTGYFTGKFCALNVCDLEPCVFGKCELTATNFKCICQSGYIGVTCEQRLKPCSDNPCEGRGECFEKNDDFFCRCHAWWEGKRCERRMLHIPYKPLSERMLQEPFWLGLITVFVVLAFIGLVWCAKRHFPEKIEKLLAEEATRNRQIGTLHGHHHHTSLREQLQFNSGTSQTTSANAQGAPRSIFNKLGSSSPRKKRNNSTPVKKSAVEKKQILQHLVSPANRVSKPNINNSDVILLSDKEQQLATESTDENIKETTFTSNANSFIARRPLSDSKLEKKVTFARLLDKVSAEMSSGSEMDGDNGTRHSSALSLHSELQFRTNSVPQSPCTNDMKSPHSTSSIQGSESASSISEIGITNAKTSFNFSKNNNSINNRRIKPKVSSADSILAMFRNLASSSTISGATSLPSTSIYMSPSTTPTPSSPQDDALGDDESSTSSLRAPVSFSIGPPDSPVFYRQTTIEVPVLDVISAHKTTSNTSMLHPPAVLLEIPSTGISKCLSPIRELPTPVPSPALTPVMPRVNRNEKMLTKKDFLITNDSELDENIEKQTINTILPQNIVDNTHKASSNNFANNQNSATTKSFAETKGVDNLKSNFVSVPDIKFEKEPNSPSDEKAQRPRNLIIPTLVVEQPSPTKNRLPVIIFPGSPPPGRASAGEKNLMFSEKPQQKRLFKQLDKPSSLDFPPNTPTITVTSNSSDLESDADVLSPSQKDANTSLLIPGVTVGMCYLSPFAICTRADRTISESNLSSSGYSSMASPGPSRCGSSNPLYSNENDDNNSGHPNLNNTFYNNLLVRRQANNLATNKDKHIGNKKSGDVADRLKLHSDSETISDEAFIESNDEGIGTDNIEEKNDCLEIKKAKEFEIYLQNDLLQSGKKLLTSDETTTMAQLRLPTMTVNQSNESIDRGLSPVSSRSESPLSEKMTGFGKFSYHFYGRKDQQLPFTDSDGLYDFPSSDGRSAPSTHHRKSNNKKRERKTNKPIQNAPANISESTLKEAHSNFSTLKHSHHVHQNISATRKSPKRRTLQRTTLVNSSSSTESLTSPQELKISTRLSLQKSKTIKIPSEEKLPEEFCNRRFCKYLNKSENKTNYLKAIGNQIRFLRRIEKSIKRRKILDSADDEEMFDDDDDEKSSKNGLLSELPVTVENTSHKSLAMARKNPDTKNVKYLGYNSF
ncbi:uncharacterized protein LOC129614250 isoform X2 [Condylostylus longicornis]|uniref:uncharacterized protein LOC129614250 isoform X2 n=1 Tax=Condylostylus longicornis TaxID=2530218 RepID=UPI00244DA7A6|nr:uncharacterized protein LOC129614250 isoform X2 [Condylostylus longicornis]